MAGGAHSIYSAMMLAICLPWGCSKSPPEPSAPSTAPKPALPKGGSAPGGGEVGKSGGDLVLSLTSAPSTLNPLKIRDAHSGEVVQFALFAPCWAFDYSKQEGMPALCESFELSEDGLTYTFTLRAGAKWSDGTPITADDAVFSHELALDPRVASPLKSAFHQGQGDDGQPRYVQIEKIDGRRFKYILTQPVPKFELLASSVRFVPKARWAAARDAGTFDEVMSMETKPEELVTSGPFMLDKYTESERLVLTRNPHYWQVDAQGQQLPYLDTVTYLITPDPNSAFMLFREGQIDLYDVRNEFVELLQRASKTRNFTVKALGPSLNTHYFMFNLDPRPDADGVPRIDPTRRQWFERQGFRKAISHAIDRASMVRVALHNRGEPLYSFISPGNTRWSGADVVEYPYDLERAGALLEAEGFTIEQRAGKKTLISPEGQPVIFTALTNAENAIRVQLLNLIKDDLDRLGITMHVRPLPFQELVVKLTRTRTFEAVLLGWGASVPPEPTLLKSVFLSSGGSHLWDPGQSSPRRPWEARMNTLIEQASAGGDDAVRKKALDELMYLFSDQLPQIMLVVESSFAAAQDRVGNFRPSPLRPKTHWNLEQLYLREGLQKGK
ncbi:MAG: ABC transporter substrate-binding protein [Bradymonadia bacterium]